MTKFKDHELEDGTIALVLLSTGEASHGSAFGMQVLRWAGRQIHAKAAARVRPEEDVMTRHKGRNPTETT